MATAAGPYNQQKMANIKLLSYKVKSVCYNYINSYGGNKLLLNTNPLVLLYLVHFNGFFEYLKQKVETDPAGFIDYMAEPSTLSKMESLVLQGFEAYQSAFQYA